MLDTVIHKATLITVNSNFDIFDNCIIGIQDQHIAIIDHPVQPLSSIPEAREILDASGCIVMPGLINTHTHLPMSLFRGLADDLPLMTWLNDHIFPAEAHCITPESVYTGAILSCAELLLSGTTTCCDGYFYEGDVAKAVSHSGMRAVLGQGVIDFPAPGIPDPSGNIMAAAKFIEQWRNTSPLIQPSVFCHSPYTCSPQTLQTAKALAVSTGTRFQIHAAETLSEHELIGSRHQMTPIQYLDSLNLLDAQTLLVHAIWMDDADMDRIARSGASISHAPESAMKLASGIARIPECIRAGIPVGLGTDGGASNNNLDMFQEMDMAAKLHKISTRDPQTMNARTVLQMATIHAAKALGMDRLIGSLEPGKLADIIILDANVPHLTPLYHPESQVVYAATGSDVRDVMVNGRWLVRNRRLTSLNLDDILDQSQCEGERIVTALQMEDSK